MLRSVEGQTAQGDEEVEFQLQSRNCVHRSTAASAHSHTRDRARNSVHSRGLGRVHYFGDFGHHVFNDSPTDQDRFIIRATQLVEKQGAEQIVATHFLDVIITRVEVYVIGSPGSASDHRLVTWPYLATPSETPVYETKNRGS